MKIWKMPLVHLFPVYKMRVWGCSEIKSSTLEQIKWSGPITALVYTLKLPSISANNAEQLQGINVSTLCLLQPKATPMMKLTPLVYHRAIQIRNGKSTKTLTLVLMCWRAGLCFWKGSAVQGFRSVKRSARKPLVGSSPVVINSLIRSFHLSLTLLQISHTDAMSLYTTFNNRPPEC